MKDLKWVSHIGNQTRNEMSVKRKLKIIRRPNQSLQVSVRPLKVFKKWNKLPSLSRKKLGFLKEIFKYNY